MAGADNADRVILRWLNLDFGVFSKESGEKVNWLPSLMILLFIAVSFQSTDSCGCGWLGTCRVFFFQSFLKEKNSGWGIVAIRWLACIGPDRFPNTMI